MFFLSQIVPRTGTGKNVTALHDMKTAIGNVVGTESGKVVDARETATVKGTGTRARGIGTGSEKGIEKTTKGGEALGNVEGA